MIVRILLVLLALTIRATVAAETPKPGGVLNFLIAADGGPSYDPHRETTYPVLHAMAPFYSVLMRVNPNNPSSTTDFVCDLCVEVPKPTDAGLTWTFQIRQDVRFHDGAKLTAHDVAASWRKIVFPGPGVASARRTNYLMIDKIEDPDDTTVVFRLKFATLTFLPAMADPWNVIFQKRLLDQDPHYHERNIMGSGPFKPGPIEVGQSVTGVRNPDYFRPGQPYLDGFKAIFAPKQSTRVEAIRADRAAMEFRGDSPSARDQLVRELGDKIAVQESDWNCGSVLTPNHQHKPLDDVRVRRALALAIDQWRGAEALRKIAIVNTPGGIVFPGSPLAATRDELVTLAGFGTDIEAARAEARRLIKDAGAEGVTLDMVNRNVDQPFTIVGTWLIDEFRKIGVNVVQRVVPSAPWQEALRSGTFDLAIEANCQSVVNPIADVGRWLPHSLYPDNSARHEDPKQVEIYDKMLRETDYAKARVLMREYERQVLDIGVHQYSILWYYRILPMRAYVKGWKISPSHYLNQDLANVWLDR